MAAIFGQIPANFRFSGALLISDMQVKVIPVVQQEQESTSDMQVNGQGERRLIIFR